MSKRSGRKNTRAQETRQQHETFRMVLRILQAQAPKLLELAKQRDAADTMGG